MRLRIITIMLFILSGCTTIIFEKEEQTEEAAIESQWHHNMVFGSVEISEPVDLSAHCPDEWSYVSTEFSFANLLAFNFSHIPAGIAAYSSGPGAVLTIFATGAVGWYPQTVELGCSGRS